MSDRLDHRPDPDRLQQQRKQQASASQPSPPTSHQPRETDEVWRVPLVEEQVQVEKRAVETAKVRVHKRVEEQRQTITESLVRDEVDVQRVPVGRQVERTESPREVDGVMIVPVYEEELVVTKRLVLKEELHIRHRRTEHREPLEVVVRKEHASVERQELGRSDADADGEINVGRSG